MNNTIIMILLAVVVFVTFLMVFAFNLQKNKAKKVLNAFKDQEVISISSNVNFFGTQSKGMGQVRGNGVLVLTKEELYFEMWMPEKILRIPIDKLQKVDTAKSFLGKSKGRPLLVLSYLNDLNEEDSSAWLVGDLESWTAALKKHLNTAP